jgi:hypothetical protein
VRGLVLRRLVVELLHFFAHTAALVVVVVNGIKAATRQLSVAANRIRSSKYVAS